MIEPLTPLDRSGRRLCAGPGPQPGHLLLPQQPVALLIVIIVAAALMLSPAAVVAWSIISAGQTDVLDIHSTLNWWPILLSGRIVVALALATNVMRATELD